MFLNFSCDLFEEQILSWIFSHFHQIYLKHNQNDNKLESIIDVITNILELRTKTNNISMKFSLSRFTTLWSIFTK